MKYLPSTTNQIQCVHSFQDLVSTLFQRDVNSICWTRKLKGDFSEIVKKIALNGTITTIETDELFELELSEQGQLARNTLVDDFNLLKSHGASPSLNLIKCYERDYTYPFFSTDVYSFHVDRSTIATDTFLCTYHGEPSEILPNSQAIQKVLVPEIRDELKKIYHGKDQEFDSFISKHFFDLHYLPKANACPISLGNGHLWRLAVDYPESRVLPCIHRAPEETDGQKRLLMIC